MDAVAVSTLRDWVIIIQGILMAAFFLVALILTLMVLLTIRGLLRQSSSLIDENVKPLIDSAKSTVDNVRGTTTYVSQTTVTPIMRGYGVIAGIRRAAAVIAGFTSASTDNADKPRE